MDFSIRLTVNLVTVCLSQKQSPEVFCKFYRKTSMLESVFNKVAGLKASNIIKNRLQHRCFPVKFAKFLRTPILNNICERLLLLSVTSEAYLGPCATPYQTAFKLLTIFVNKSNHRCLRIS